MNKSTVFLTLLLGIGLGLLGARFFADEPAPVAKPAAAAPVEPTPAPIAKVKAPKPVAEAPKAVAKADEETARQEARAKAKVFMEETKKMAEEIAGGDQNKLQRAVMSGMMKPENQALMKEMRELGNAMRNATPEEREVLGQQAVALRDRAMAALRAEVAALPDLGAAAPAPVIIM